MEKQPLVPQTCAYRCGGRVASLRQRQY